MAAYGSVVLGTKLDSTTSSACGTPDSITNAFKSQGVLKRNSGPCSGQDLAALSSDLGLVGSVAHNVTFTIGFDREQAISFLNTTDYTGYYRTKWPTIPRAVQFVLQDYNQALRESIAFDSEIHSRAKSLSGTWGDNYAAIIDASVRQAFGSIELVVSLGYQVLTYYNADVWSSLDTCNRSHECNFLERYDYHFTSRLHQGDLHKW